MRGRLGAALRAGRVTLFLSLLCAATLAAPRLAAEPDFGHTHPHGSEQHLHPFKLVLGYGESTAPAAALEPDLPVSLAAHHVALPWVSAAAGSHHHSRAPPA